MELLAGRPSGAAEHGIAHRVVAYGAKRLTEGNVSVIAETPASQNAWRQAARGMIPAFAEIRLVGPAATRRERERGPDAADDEESADAELTVRADEGGVERAADEVLLVTQRLAAAISGAFRRPAGAPGQGPTRRDAGAST